MNEFAQAALVQILTQHAKLIAWHSSHKNSGVECVVLDDSFYYDVMWYAQYVQYDDKHNKIAFLQYTPERVYILGVPVMSEYEYLAVGNHYAMQIKSIDWLGNAQQLHDLVESEVRKALPLLHTVSCDFIFHEAVFHLTLRFKKSLSQKDADAARAIVFQNVVFQ